MFFTKKTITVPASNEVKEIEAVQLWEVRWRSRHGDFSGETSPQVEAFPTQELAEEFATALRNAFTLIRHTYGIKVTVQKAKSYHIPHKSN